MNRKYLIFAAAATSLSFCKAGSRTQPQADLDVSPPSTSEGESVATFLISLPADGDVIKAPCVLAVPEAEREQAFAAIRAYQDASSALPARWPCLYAVQDLEAHVPSLIRDVAAPNLAGAIHHLRGRVQDLESRIFVDKPLFDFETLLGPFDLSEYSLWKRSSEYRGPDIKTLRPAAFNLDRSELSFDLMTRTLFDVERQSLVVAASRVRVDLGEEGWPQRSEEMPLVDYHAPRVTEADRVFGGSVEGVVQIPLGDEHWYIAIEPSALVSAYVWRDKGGKKTTYADLASLAAKHPIVRSADGRNTAASVFLRHFVQPGFSVITDAAAWKREYQEKGYQTLFNSRYYQGTTYQDPVNYTIADFDAIADPKWQGETLVVHLAGSRNHQPYRVEIALGTLAMDTSLKPTFLATFESSQGSIDRPTPPPPMPPPANKR